MSVHVSEVRQQAPVEGVLPGQYFGLADVQADAPTAEALEAIRIGADHTARHGRATCQHLASRQTGPPG